MSSDDDIPPLTELEGVDVSLNFIERLTTPLDANDDFLKSIAQTNQGILEANRLRARQVRQRGAMDGSFNLDQDGEDGGMFSIPEADALPQDAIGLIVRDTQPNNTGPAVFQLNGTRFYSLVRNSDDEKFQAGTTVRVLGGGNRVTARGAGGGFGVLGGSGLSSQYFRYQGRLYRIPEVTTRGEEIKVSNQIYDGDNYYTVSPDLGAGATKEMVRVEPPNDAFFLLKHTNATIHDTVRYDYYIDNQTTRDPDLSGQTPWASPPDLHEVVPDGWKLVEDYVYVEMVEESGSTTYSTVQASLTGIEIEV